MKNEAAQQLGKLGGEKRSEAKTAAARNNASKPRGKWMTAMSFAYICEDGTERDGVALVRGKGPENMLKNMEWMRKKISEEPLHRKYFTDNCEITRLEAVGKKI